MASPREFTEDEIGKEMQIKILKEKLEFVNNQLEEKDKQLDHYKQLCKTLKDLVSELSGRQRAAAAPAITHSQSSSSVSPITASSSSTAKDNKLRPPPGFEPKKNSIKGRKVRSFTTIRESFEEEPFDDHEVESPWAKKTESSDALSPTAITPSRSDQLSWRKPATVTSPVSDTEKLPQFPEQKSPSSSTNGIIMPASRLKKSVSQSSIGNTWNNTDKEKEREVDQLVSEQPAAQPPVQRPTNTVVFMASQNQQPQRNPISPSFSTTAVSTTVSADTIKSKNSKLKKSQSMNSVYTVLEENRLDLKFPELDQLLGQIYPLSKYQQGCRFLQKKLDEKNPTNTNIILNELYDHLVELLTDPFGNYLFSKLMEHCDTPQRDRIVNKILTDLLTVAFDMYGTQSLQKMMPFLTETQIENVINSLKPSAIALIKHNKANYLIQYCLDHLPPKHNQWIYDAVVASMEEIARDRVGCVIVKRCIDHATPEQKLKLANEVANRSLALVQDPFGNYVVQHILEKFPHEEASSKMILNLQGSVGDLCVQKFSSNVVEKCLQVATPEVKAVLLGEIIESDMLPQLLNDRFANFVVQTALDVAAPEQRQQLVKNILPHLGRHYSPYTKRLQKKILQVQ